MVINPFLAGILATLFLECVPVVVFAIISTLLGWGK